VPDDATTGEPEGRKPRPSGGQKPRLRFPKAARLIRTAEFSRVRTDGKPVHGKMITLGVLKGCGEADGRIGIVTSRRVGGAVVRNRVRRRLREIFRAMRPRLVPGVWIVAVAKSSAAKATFEALRAECAQLARRGALLLDPAP